MVINARHAPCTFGQQNSHMWDIKLVQFLCFSCRFFPPQERHRICNSFFLDLPSSSSHVGAFYRQNVDKKGVWCVFKSEKRCLVDKFFPQSIGVIYIYIPSRLQGTNISPKNGILKMIVLFPRWDMLVPWRVYIIYFLFTTYYMKKSLGIQH